MTRMPTKLGRIVPTKMARRHFIGGSGAGRPRKGKLFEQSDWHANEKREGDPMKQRGVFEKEPGSGVWWIRYFDQFGKKRREKHCGQTLREAKATGALR
jgi:hypothetical protein